MSDFFECYFFWVLLGLFLGFFLFWLYDKLFRRDGSALPSEKDKEIQSLRTQNISIKSELENANSRLKQIETEEEQIDIAVKYGFSPFKNGEDDLTTIEGIGPKISGILKDNGFKTFSDVAGSQVHTLQKLLDDKGSSFRLAKPDSWPKQASICAKGDWAELKKYQNRLVNGIEFDE